MSSQNQQSNHDSAQSGNAPTGSNSTPNTANNSGPAGSNPSSNTSNSNVSAGSSAAPAAQATPKKALPPHMLTKEERSPFSNTASRPPTASTSTTATPDNSSQNTLSSTTPAGPSSGPAQQTVPSNVAVPQSNRPAQPTTSRFGPETKFTQKRPAVSSSTSAANSTNMSSSNASSQTPPYDDQYDAQLREIFKHTVYANISTEDFRNITKKAALVSKTPEEIGQLSTAPHKFIYKLPKPTPLNAFSTPVARPAPGDQGAPQHPLEPAVHSSNDPPPASTSQDTQVLRAKMKQKLQGTIFADISDEAFEKIKWDKAEKLIVMSEEQISGLSATLRLVYGLPFSISGVNSAGSSQGTATGVQSGVAGAKSNSLGTARAAAADGDKNDSTTTTKAVSSVQTELKNLSLQSGSETGNTSNAAVAGPQQKLNLLEHKFQFSDATYATSDGSAGKEGSTVKVRVNRFNIGLDSIPSKLSIYNVVLPQVNGRDVKSPGAKKILLEQIINFPGLQSAFSQHKLFSDRDGLIVSKEPLESFIEPLQKDCFAVPIKPHWQKQDPSGVPELHAKVELQETLDKEEFVRYVNGARGTDFNFSGFVRAFNIMARHFSHEGSVRVGRNRIFEEDSETLLPSGLEARQGFHVSVRPANRHLQLQVQSSATGFFPDRDLRTFVETHWPSLRQQPATPAIKRDANGVLRNLQVRLRYTPQDPKKDPNSRSRTIDKPTGPLKRISEIGGTSDEVQFEHDFWTSQEKWSVREHFNEHVLRKPLHINRPHLPVVNTGDRQEPRWTPTELLHIAPHQPYRGPVPSGDVAEMAKFARIGPQDNVKLIQGAGLDLLKAKQLIKHGVLRLSEEMLEVGARMLRNPAIVCKGKMKSEELKLSQTSSGKWNFSGKQVEKPGQASQLLVIKIANAAQHRPDTFFDTLTANLKGYGVTGITGTPIVRKAASAMTDALDVVWSALESKQRNSIKIIFVVLDGRDQTSYATIKSWGDVKTGVHTVCIQQAKLGNLDASFYANLALKFNVKLGGTNFRLNDKFYNKLQGDKPKEERNTVMVVGADVTHPGPGSINFCPSIAAVVASTDRHCVNYPGSMRLQAGRTEEILELRDMMEERLRLFQKHNDGELPEKILFYRDGVSEDQYAMVKHNELPHIIEACDRVRTGYRPLITLVVCTKRHQTRFYPNAKAKPTAGTIYDHKGNFRPGLVVDDSNIRLPKYFDFWLQAHAPLQGTARPCYYFVLHDENKHTADKLQETTNALSWVYQTSLTPISQVAPAYYADKLAERGRCYIRALLVASHPQRDVAEAMLANQVAQYERGGRSLTLDSAKRAAYARWFQTGMGGFWPARDKKNPCHVNVEDSMFFV